MKKLTLVVMLLMTIFLVSCGSSERQAVVDFIETPAYEELKLDSVKNGVSINSNLDKSKESYVDIKIASNAKDTLVYDVIKLDDYLNKDFKGINVKVLFFNDGLYSQDLAKFLLELNNEEYGLSDEKIGVNFTEDACSKKLYGDIDSSISINLPKEYDLESAKDNVLVVAYLPVYCIYNESNQDYTKIFLLVPVFYSLTYNDNGIENGNFDNLREYNVVLNDKGLLPSKTNDEE